MHALMRAIWVLCGPVMAISMLIMGTITFLVMFERRALKAELKAAKANAVIK